MSLAPYGFFDQLIDVYRPGTQVVDDTGKTNTAAFAIHLTNLSAAVRPQAGSEGFERFEISTVQPVDFYVEPGLDITQTDLILWDGRYHEITAPPVNNAAQGRFLKLVAVYHANKSYTELVA